MPETSAHPAAPRAADEPRGPQVADQRGHKPHQRGSGEEDDLGEQDVGGEPNRPGGDSGVGDVRNLTPTQLALSGVVGAFGAASNAAHDLLPQ